MGENRQIRSPQFDLDAKWDACLDLGLRRFVYSSFAGAVGGLLLFRSPVTRWASVAFGAGVGIGSACTDCSYKFDRSPAKLPFPNILDTPASPPSTPSQGLVGETTSIIYQNKNTQSWMDRIETRKLFEAFSQDFGSKSDLFFVSLGWVLLFRLLLTSGRVLPR